MAHGHSTSHATGSAHKGVGHVVSPKILIANAAALLVLTGITVWSVKLDFHQLDLNELNIVIAMAIACLKGTLVCLFFMHLRWDRPFNQFIMVGSLAFVALFIAFAMTDTFAYRPDVIKDESATVTAAIEAGKAERAAAEKDAAAGAHGLSNSAH